MGKIPAKVAFNAILNYKIKRAVRNGKFTRINCPDLAKGFFWFLFHKCIKSHGCSNSKAEIDSWGNKSLISCDGKFYLCLVCEKMWEYKKEAATCFLGHGGS